MYATRQAQHAPSTDALALPSLQGPAAVRGSNAERANRFAYTGASGLSDEEIGSWLDVGEGSEGLSTGGPDGALLAQGPAGPGRSTDVGGSTQGKTEGKDGKESTRKAAEEARLASRIADAILYNREAHSISMLVRIRAFLVEKGYMSAAATDAGDRLDQSPETVVDRAFVEGVIAWQKHNRIDPADGRIGSTSFRVLQKYAALSYSVNGGTQPRTVKRPDGRKVPRTVISRGASPDAIYAYFRRVVLDQGGIWMDEPGCVNLVGVRGGRLVSDTKGCQVEASPNGTTAETGLNSWNDTLIVFKVNGAGKKVVDMFEGTTDPGAASDAFLVEGTHAYELGEHAPENSGYPAYPALNPSNGPSGAANQGLVPVSRNGKTCLGTEEGGGKWLNVHTTHGNKAPLSDSLGGYSRGCSVVNGQDTFTGRFMPYFHSAVDNRHQQVFYYTVISVDRLEGVVVKEQRPQRKPAPRSPRR